MAVDVRGSRGSLGFYALIATAITTTLLAMLAHVLQEPFGYLSVGPPIFIFGVTCAPADMTDSKIASTPLGRALSRLVRAIPSSGFAGLLCGRKRIRPRH